MNIAIIAWGSLVWSPGNLRYRDDWEKGGPRLPIEFSRVSSDCRLTLVLDGKHGVDVGTRFAVSARRYLEDAIADLRDREGTIWNRIGFVDLHNGTDSARTFKQPKGVFDSISDWAKHKDLDAAVWTALPPSFEDQTGVKFDVENVSTYLRELPKSAQKHAIEYLEKAPAEVGTPVRNHLAKSGLIKGKDEWGLV